MDLYSTDPEIAYYDLVALIDDRQFFPDYEAVFLYRDTLPPEAVAAKVRALETLLLGITSILQTIPSLALLVLMIPLFGIRCHTGCGAGVAGAGFV